MDGLQRKFHIQSQTIRYRFCSNKSNRNRLPFIIQFSDLLLDGRLFPIPNICRLPNAKHRTFDAINLLLFNSQPEIEPRLDITYT